MFETGITEYSPPVPHVGNPTRLIIACTALEAKFAGAIPVGTGTDSAGESCCGRPETTEHAPLLRIVEVTANAVNTR